MNSQLRAIMVASILLLLPAIVQSADLTGRIAAVDAERHTITLTTGVTLFVADAVSIVGLEPGQDVKITFEKTNGRLIAVKLSGSDAET